MIANVTDLKKLSLFSKIDSDTLQNLLPLMSYVYFAPGQTVIREGEAGDCLYIIMNGGVNYVTYTDDSQEVMLGSATAGEVFGELSMLTGKPRAVRVVANDASTMLSLENKAFESFLIGHPNAAIEVMRTLALRLHHSDEILRESGTKNVNQIDDNRTTTGERISDWLANLIGSWLFIATLSFILVMWVGWNTTATIHNMMHETEKWPLWDAYPFVFLNLALSFLAAYSAPIIMMSQNRAASKDRLSAEIDHGTNVRAELQIGHIIKRLDDLEKSIHHKLP